MEKDNKQQKKREDLTNAGIAGASYERVQRFGAAAKEHYVAYSGQDKEIGKKLAKGLKKISQEKVHPDYKYKNIQQQAGFSAEVKETARYNEKKIIEGESKRKHRTDDLGKVNDPLYDHEIKDKKGVTIEGEQMKFVGASESDPQGTGDAKRALNYLRGKRCDKYFDKDVAITVPSDQYDGIIKEADKEIEKLSKQLENREKAGDTELVKRLQEKIDRLEKIKKNIRKSSVTNKEAVFARMHPGLSTAVDVVRVAHKAGVQTAETAAIISSSVSIVRNVVSVCKGEIGAKDAAKSIVTDTAKGAAVGYGTGFVGSALKGAMQNSGSEYVRTLSKTNLAGTVVSVTVSATKTLSRFFNGEIDGAECLEELGEQGTGTIASAMFAVVGQAAIPIPVVGALVGGMVGYALSSATYSVLTDSLKDAKLAKEERKRIEEACKEYIDMIREYRKEIEELINEYLCDYMDVFRESFSGITNALAIGDVEWFIDSSNTIVESFGGEKSFTSMEDFNDKMMHGSGFTL